MNQPHKSPASNQSRLLLALIILGASLTLRTFFLSHQALFISGSNDLRNRIVGARVAQLGHNPYAPYWQPGMPDTLLDPLVPTTSQISRLTTTPANLIFHLPFLSLHYLIQVKIWYWLQWLLALITLLILLRAHPKPHHQKTTLALFLLTTGSPVWMLNLVYGQIYILYTLLITLILTLPKPKHLRPIILGLLIALRPSFLITPLYLFFKKLNHTATTSLLTLALTATITALIFYPNIWTDYQHSISFISIVNKSTIQRTIDPLQLYPSIVEGIPLRLFPTKVDQAQTSIKWLAIKHLNLTIPTPILTLAILTTLLALTHLSHKYLKPSTHTTLLTGLTLAIVAEYFIPAPKGLYSEIVWLPIIINSLTITKNNNETTS